jgi:flavin reductase (DIM6/NTAB) family NADH-FMN oxidoreductase RutF
MDFDLSKVSNHQTYNLLVGLVAPRPIAWITSHDREGRLNGYCFLFSQNAAESKDELRITR